MKINLLLIPCRILAMILVVASFALPARAALLVYEGFQYTAGTDLIPPGGGSGQGTGLGWSGPWFTTLVIGGFPIDASSLYPPTAAIAPTGGSIRQSILSPFEGFHARRLITPRTIAPGADLWLSADMATGAEASTRNEVHFFFSPYGESEGAKVLFATESPTPGVTEHWSFYTPFYSPGFVYGPEIVPDVPALLVAKVHRDELTDLFTFKFWVNPGPATNPTEEPSEPPVQTRTVHGFYSTLYYVLLAGGGKGVHQFDEIRIGSSYADINTVPNVAPIAVADLAATLEDASVNIAAVANDTDLNGDTLTVASFTQAANGTVTLNPDGTLSYTPYQNFNGTDSFSYTVTDGALTAVGTVVVSVAPINDNPTAVGDAVTIDEDTSVTLNVLANDTDVDGDALLVQSVTQGAHGLVVLNPDGSVTYHPVPDFYGADAFTYTLSDGHGGTATATVAVTVAPVNDPPVAVADAAVTLEDTSVNIPVLANDADEHGDTLTLVSFTQGANGTVTLNPDGTLNYTPSLNFNGTDSFNYSVSDGVLTSVGAVVVSVESVNDVPTAGSDSAVTDEETPVTLNVIANDSDVDGDALLVESVTQGAHGTVVLNPNDSVTYQPEPNFNGSDAFTYTASDGQGGTTIASVNVTVRPVNDPPVASNGSATGLEDLPLEIVLQASDVDGDALTFAIVTPPLHGTLSALDGNRVTYTPALNYSGEDRLTFRASDGQATANAVVRLTIGPVNDPPVLGPVTDRTVNEGTALSFQLTATDPEGDTLTCSSPDLPSGATLNATTGEFTWTPNFAQAGAYPVTFTVADPSGGLDSKTITIRVVDVSQNANQDPNCSRAVPSVGEIWPPNHKQVVAIDILGVTDPDGDAVSITITKILQDEPTNTLGDGSTWVDGAGIGTARALVRAERSGTPRVPGNGRVYEIFFTASDSRGGTCSSSVKVGVPHDQDHRPAIDDGVRYDSTVPGGPRVN